MPLVEFSINNAYQSSIGTTPFFLNYGQHPRSPNGVPDMRGSSLVARVQRIESALVLAKDSTMRAQAKMSAFANNRRRDLEFSVGDFVLLSADNVRRSKELPYTKKLAHRYYGPFDVISRVDQLNYELEIPASMQVYDVFHVSAISLKLYRRKGDGVKVPPPAFLPSGSLEDEISEIADHFVHLNGQMEFLVVWKDGSQPLWCFSEDFMKYSRVLVSKYCSSVGLTVPKGKAQAKKARGIAQNADRKILRVGSRRSGRIAARAQKV